MMDQITKKKNKKWLKILFISLVSFITFIVLLACIAGYIVFSQKQLTPIVNKALNYYMKANVKIDSVELCYFSTYPFLSLEFGKATVLAKNNLEDTLLYVNGGKARINLTAYLLNKDLLIDKLELFGGITKVSFDEQGKLNWDIFVTSKDSLQTKQKKDTAPLSDIFNTMDIQRIFIRSGKIAYQDFRTQQKLDIQDADVKIKGSFMQKNLLSKIKLDLNNLHYQDKGTNAYLAKLESTIDGNGNLLGNSGLDADFLLDSVNYQHLSSNLNLFFPNLKLNISSAGDSSSINVNVATSIKNVNVDLAKQKYLKNSQVDLLLNAQYQRLNNSILFNNATIKVNDIAFKLNGNVRIKDSAYYPNLKFELQETPINSIYKMAIERYVTSALKVDIRKGSIHCDGNVSGCYSPKSLPRITSHLSIHNLEMNLNKLRVDTFNFIAFADLKLNDLPSSFIKIKDLKYVGGLGKLTINGNVKGLTKNPFIDTKVFVNFDLKKLKYIFRNNLDYTTEGNLKVDFNGQFALQDMINFNPKKAKLEGIMNIDSIKIANPNDSLNVEVDYARIKFGSQVDDSTLTHGKALLKVSVRLDSLNLNYKNKYIATLGRLSTGYKFEGKIDSEVSAATARLTFRGLRFRMPSEKLIVRTTKTSTSIKITPNPDKKKSPILTAKLTSDTFIYRGRGNGLRLLNMEVVFAIKPMKSQKRLASIRAQRTGQPRDTSAEAKKQRSLDRLRNMSTEKLLKALFTYISSKDTTTDKSEKFVRQFAYEGILNFNNLRMRLQALPLRIQIAKTSIGINARTLELKNTDIKLGKSDFNVTGSLSNFKRAMFNNGVLNSELHIKSKFVDANELMLALMQGASSSSNQNKTSPNDNDFFNTPALDTAQKATEVVAIPKNINFTMTVDIDTMPMGKSLLRKLDGDMEIKEEHLFLSNFRVTNESGRINVRLAYKADSSKQFANLWTNLMMRKIELKSLVNMYPALDTLLPMVKSFEGLINCYFTASTKMNPGMEILLAQTIATCNLAGKNLVLLDGETFAEIAKMLMFKNKAKNDIDSISVDLALKNGTIDIFPFLISMDRYELAVGGTQGLDNSLNYHISVLRSPVPLIKLGVNITGTTDKFSWKLTNAKYKDLTSPALSKKIANNTFSVQQELRRLMQYELSKIVPSQDSSLPQRRGRNR